MSTASDDGPVNDNDPRLARPIAQAAADWIVRRDGATFSAEDERLFAAWLADPAHRDAFARLERMWGLLDAAPALPSVQAPAPRRRWMAVGAAVAAMLVLALGALEDWPTRLRADYATGVGERRSVLLADGSHIVLGNASAMAVDVAGGRRRVRLLKGEAMFQVAPDRSRPFTVEAAGGSATALGTAFAIRSDGSQATIVVTQHAVAVVGKGRREVVSEGQRADFGAQTLGRAEAADQGATAWTSGHLIVVNRPLSEVVSEIARHRRGYLGVAGSAADVRVSGVYDLDHPLAAIDSIQHSLNLGSLRLSDRIVVLHR